MGFFFLIFSLLFSYSLYYPAPCPPPPTHTYILGYFFSCIFQPLVFHFCNHIFYYSCFMIPTFFSLSCWNGALTSFMEVCKWDRSTGGLQCRVPSWTILLRGGSKVFRSLGLLGNFDLLHGGHKTGCPILGSRMRKRGWEVSLFNMRASLCRGGKMIFPFTFLGSWLRLL